jgi:hypothetical protein
MLTWGTNGETDRYRRVNQQGEGAQGWVQWALMCIIMVTDSEGQPGALERQRGRAGGGMTICDDVVL